VKAQATNSTAGREMDVMPFRVQPITAAANKVEAAIRANAPLVLSSNEQHGERRGKDQKPGQRNLKQQPFSEKCTAYHSLLRLNVGTDWDLTGDGNPCLTDKSCVSKQ
jgi:hypothetical protein